MIFDPHLSPEITKEISFHCFLPACREVTGHRRWTHPEVNPVTDPTGERRVDRFIKLKEDLKSQLRSDLLSLDTNTRRDYHPAALSIHTLTHSVVQFTALITHVISSVPPGHKHNSYTCSLRVMSWTTRTSSVIFTCFYAKLG